jgi:hypothetical protein
MNKEINKTTEEIKQVPTPPVTPTKVNEVPISEASPVKQEQKPKVKEIKKNIPKKEELPKKKESVAPSSVVGEEGINLIPTMSTDEIKVDEKKKKMNKSALVSISILFSVSILVIGFNIISKIQLNTQKEKLYAMEEKMSSYNQLLINNTEIIERVLLYQDIQEGKFSTKAVIGYIEEIAKKSGSSELNEFSFSGGKSFAFSGDASDLEDIAKLWYLLTNDTRMENINLKSVSKSDLGARFSFTGELKLDQFTN